jgi:hypothetical protein
MNISRNPMQLGDSQAYKDQGLHRIKLKGLTQLYSTTVTSGVIANSYSINASSNVTGFSTRFASTFDEYRIIKAIMKIRPCSASTGLTRFFFDELSGTNPTQNDALERVGIELCNSNANSSSTKEMHWSPRDLDDQNFVATTASVTPCYLKIYTDAAVFGAPATVTPLWLISQNLTVEFRGLKST